MKNGLWFIGGFIAGIVTLCAALVMLHGWVPLAPNRPTPVEEEIQQKLLTLLNRILDFTEQAQKEFVAAGNDARESALCSDLQTVRSQIELYKVQHLDNYPGFKSDGSFDGDLFVRQMVSRTNTAGQVMPADGNEEDYPYGPYLHHMPDNPFVEGEASHKVTGGTADCPGDGESGWYVRTKGGNDFFYANDKDHKDL